MFFTRRQLLRAAAAGTLTTALPRLAVAQVEPFSAAWVIAALCQGAISYIGGAAFASAIGAVGFSDVHSWILDAVASLEQFFTIELKRQLDQQTITQMSAQLQNVKNNLNEFASIDSGARQRESDLIAQSDTLLNGLIPLSIPYDQAFFIAAAAMAYKLTVLQVRARVEKKVGYVKSGEDFLNDFFASAVTMRKNGIAALQPESHLKLYCVQVPSPNPSMTLNDCEVIQDNRAVADWHGFGGNRPDLNADAQANYNNRRTDLAAIQSEFQTKSLQCLRSLEVVYQVMCQKIGATYSIPVNIKPPDWDSLQGSLARFKLTDPFVMHGAIAYPVH